MFVSEAFDCSGSQESFGVRTAQTWSVTPSCSIGKEDEMNPFFEATAV